VKPQSLPANGGLISTTAHRAASRAACAPQARTHQLTGWQPAARVLCARLGPRLPAQTNITYATHSEFKERLA
jgi:hypothetical protein